MWQNARRLRRALIAILALSAIALISASCSTGAPAIDHPEPTLPVPSVTAAG
jgi:hypothetical protein